MSRCANAMVAAKRAVAVPTIATTAPATGEASKIGAVRATRYTPAVTMVAAWIRADTGVGPSMASGSHTYNGNCADLPAAPTRSSNPMAVAVPEARPWAPSSTSSKRKLPKWSKTTMRATMNPTSPTRLTMNAFLPAAAADSFSNQNEISR